MSNVRDIAQLRQTCWKYFDLLEGALYRFDVAGLMKAERDLGGRGDGDYDKNTTKWERHQDRPAILYNPIYPTIATQSRPFIGPLRKDQLQLQKPQSNTPIELTDPLIRKTGTI